MSPANCSEEQEGATTTTVATTQLAQNTEIRSKAARHQDRKTTLFKSLVEETVDLPLPCHEVKFMTGNEIRVRGRPGNYC